jgi:HK97 family phage major capsid protein
MNGTVRYYDQSTTTRNAAAKAEAAEAPESALAWTEYSASLCKIMDSIPITYEAWTDLDFAYQEINSFLDTNIALKEDQDLWNGDGSAPDISGIYTYAGTFNAGTSPYSGAITSGNIADLAMAMYIAITTNKQSKFRPQTIILNPADAMRLNLYKATDGHYILNPNISGEVISGMRVVASPAVTANTMLVGDFNWGQYWTEGTTRIELGHKNDSFTKDFYYLKAVKRALLLVRSVDTGAFLKSTSISADLATLTS